MKKKNKGGRPTKYDPEKTIHIISAITAEMNTQNFLKYCSAYHLSVILGINTDTFYAWLKRYTEFSEAVKNWETKRNSLLFEFKGWSDAMRIFCMKNWMGMTDRHDVEASGDIKITIKRIITEERPGE